MLDLAYSYSFIYFLNNRTPHKLGSSDLHRPGMWTWEGADLKGNKRISAIKIINKIYLELRYGA